jgi:hypothetical protein
MGLRGGLHCILICDDACGRCAGAAAPLRRASLAAAPRRRRRLGGRAASLACPCPSAARSPFCCAPSPERVDHDDALNPCAMNTPAGHATGSMHLQDCTCTYRRRCSLESSKALLRALLKPAPKVLYLCTRVWMGHRNRLTKVPHAACAQPTPAPYIQMPYAVCPCPTQRTHATGRSGWRNSIVPILIERSSKIRHFF